MYSPVCGPTGAIIDRAGIVMTPVDESIVKRTFTPGTSGWLKVHTPPDGVPELIIGDALCGLSKSNGHPIGFGKLFCIAYSMVKEEENGGHDDVFDIIFLQTNLQHFERSLYRRYGLVSVVSA